MKGTTPTAAQKRFHDLLASHVGCLPCLQMTGQRNFHVSIHHLHGRTKPYAHWRVLGLCAGHHQDGTGAPGLIAVHPHKARFEREHGSQMDLLRQSIQELMDMGYDVPAEALSIL